MIHYAILAIALLAFRHFHPVLFALFEAATSLFDAAEIARDARPSSIGAPVPLADDMEPFRMEAAPSETGTTRVADLPEAPRLSGFMRRALSLVSMHGFATAASRISNAKNDATR